MSEETQAQIDELREEHKNLNEAVTLRHKQEELKTVEGDLSELAKTAQKLSQSGYIHGAALSEQVQTLVGQIGQIRTLFTQVLNTASSRLQAELGQANLTVGSALGGQVSLIDSATEALNTLRERVENAEDQLDLVLQPLVEAHNQLDGLFNQLEWSLEQWNEFSGDRNSSGKLLVAATAEWKQTGRGSDDPDGNLYLTDKALIFEQKEKKGKTLGLFGGKMVQEVEWSIPLSDLTDVRSKNEGMFGGRDIIFVTVSSGNPAPEVKIELKGSADNNAWVSYINNVKQGHTLVETEKLEMPDIDLSEWDGSGTSISFNLSGLGTGNISFSIGDNKPKAD